MSETPEVPPAEETVPDPVPEDEGTAEPETEEE
jgi:hypothetical protein